MDKREALVYLNNELEGHFLDTSNTHWANLSNYGDNVGWWLNVPFNKFNDNLYFVLNNDNTHNLLFIHIPNNAINNPQALFRNKDNTADIFIEYPGVEPPTNADPLIDVQYTGANYDFSQLNVELFHY